MKQWTQCYRSCSYIEMHSFAIVNRIRPDPELRIVIASRTLTTVCYQSLKKIHEKSSTFLFLIFGCD